MKLTGRPGRHSSGCDTAGCWGSYPAALAAYLPGPVWGHLATGHPAAVEGAAVAAPKLDVVNGRAATEAAGATDGRGPDQPSCSGVRPGRIPKEGCCTFSTCWVDWGVAAS